MANTTVAASVPPSFDLNRIHLVEIFFTECTIQSDKAPRGPVDSVQFKLGQLLLEPSFDMKAGRVYYDVSIKAESTEANNPIPIATGIFRLHFGFEIENLAEYSTNAPDFDGPFPVRDLMVMLGGVAYSTARGMLLLKTAATALSGFALPLRSPQEIFQESMKLLAEQNAIEPKKRVIKRANKKPKAT